MKRTISLLLSLIMVLMLIPFSAFGVNAEEDYVDSQDVHYILSEDGTYYIVSSVGYYYPASIVIPETINGLPVKEIGYEAFYYRGSLTSKHRNPQFCNHHWQFCILQLLKPSKHRNP